MNQRPKIKIESYRDLMVWQKAVDLVVECYRLTKRLPATEVYGLSSQVQRAAVSIPANIAEGDGRKHLGDYLQHLSIANGSLKELETHLLVASRLSYPKTTSEIQPALALAEEVGRMLAGLMGKLRGRSFSRGSLSPAV
jgi:four helix bundle protein